MQELASKFEEILLENITFLYNLNSLEQASIVFCFIGFLVCLLLITNFFLAILDKISSIFSSGSEKKLESIRSSNKGLRTENMYLRSEIETLKYCLEKTGKNNSNNPSETDQPVLESVEDKGDWRPNWKPKEECENESK